MTHHYIPFLVPPKTTPVFVSLDVHGGQTFAHTTPTSSSFHPLIVYSLDIAICIRGFKCLNVAKGRIYISHDVIFEENVFPFASMHSSAGARYHSKILLTQPWNNAVTDARLIPLL
jgi:hypothetical protein